MDEEELEYKAILLGNSGVGKTNLINTSNGEEFNSNQPSTVATSYVKKTLKINGQKFVVNLWDTCGQEKYSSLSKIFLRGSKIVILVYDITDKHSFEKLDDWIQMAKETEINCIYGIIGNKCDLFLEEQVSEEEARNFAKSKGYKFRLASAKSDPNSLNEFLEVLVQDYNEANNIKAAYEKSFTLDDGNNDNEENQISNCCKGRKKRKEK